MRYVFDDGGREHAGFRDARGDCVCRAIAIGTGQSYGAVYVALAALAAAEVQRDPCARRSSPARGVSQRLVDAYLGARGWRWTAAPSKAWRLEDGTFPAGRFIVAIPRHLTCVIDGVLHDIYDCSQRRRRAPAILGFFSLAYHGDRRWVETCGGEDVMAA